MPQPGFQIILLKALIASELSDINYQLNANINDCLVSSKLVVGLLR